MPSLEDIRKGWDHAARTDAMFNILTQPGMDNGKWDPQEFFWRGRDEINSVLKRLDELDIRGRNRDRALDFGCGLGRITQALAIHYKQVDGVDISGEMVRQAEEFNVFGYRVRYHKNTKAKLGLFEDETFDFIYSVIVLQHMPQRLQRGYVTEFVRLLTQDGLAVFQIPEGREYEHPQPWLSMYGTDRETVEGWISEADGRLLDVEVSEHSGQGWKGWRYCVGRDGA